MKISLQITELNPIIMLMDFCLFRPNIRFDVLPRPSVSQKVSAQDSFDQILLPLIKDVLKQGVAYPKTIVYLPLQWCQHAHTTACRMAGLSLEDCDVVEDGELQSHFAQYHAPQGKQVGILLYVRCN